MDALRSESPLQVWRARWREIGTRVRGASRRTSERDRPWQVGDRAKVDIRSSRNVPAPAWMDAVEEARQDWMHARSFFDAVEDPDLIDHAIYQVQAAESRYMYLLRKVRESARDGEARQVAGPPLAQSASSSRA